MANIQMSPSQSVHVVCPTLNRASISQHVNYWCKLHLQTCILLAYCQVQNTQTKLVGIGSGRLWCVVFVAVVVCNDFIRQEYELRATWVKFQCKVCNLFAMQQSGFAQRNEIRLCKVCLSLCLFVCLFVWRLNRHVRSGNFATAL